MHNMIQPAASTSTRGQIRNTPQYCESSPCRNAKCSTQTRHVSTHISQVGEVWSHSQLIRRLRLNLSIQYHSAPRNANIWKRRALPIILNNQLRWYIFEKRGNNYTDWLGGQRSTYNTPIIQSTKLIPMERIPHHKTRIQWVAVQVDRASLTMMWLKKYVHWFQTEIPRLIVSYVRDSPNPAVQWTKDSLEDVCLGVLCQLAMWPSSREALIRAGAIPSLEQVEGWVFVLCLDIMSYSVRSLEYLACIRIFIAYLESMVTEQEQLGAAWVNCQSIMATELSSLTLLWCWILQIC